jgi:hypothetical protein
MSPPAPTETVREVSCTATSVRIGGGCVKRGCSTSITIARIAARVPPAAEPVDVDVDVEAAVLAVVTAVVQRSHPRVAIMIADARHDLFAVAGYPQHCCPAATDGAFRFTHIHTRVRAGRQSVSERARLCKLDETLSPIAAFDLADEGVLKGASLLFTIRTCRPRGRRRVRPPKPRGPR